MTPLICESVTINARLETVWLVFTDLSRWNDWNTVLAVVPSEGEDQIVEGAGFTCLIRPFVFAVTLKPLAREVLPYKRIVLSGSRFGMRARHEFLFDKDQTKTTVTSRETFAGILPALPGWVFLERRVRSLTCQMLHDLKTALENFPADQE